MAIQFNDITSIGDAFELHAGTPILGIQTIVGYTDEVLNETAERFFDREFRISTNGITYGEWMELTDENLINVFVTEGDIFDVHYRYTRAGTDATGFLTFVSIQITGTLEGIEPPKIFTDLYFNKFFNYNDNSVLNWALNVLDKLYKRGIVANYLTRNTPGVDDADYLALFGTLTHFMAILVRYAREFQDFNLNDLLLTEYLRQRGVFVSDDMDLTDLQNVLSSIYVNFLERGTNEIVKQAGVDGRLVDGELIRLIRRGEFDEFIWGLIEPEKTIWNVNNNSPMYRGTKGAVNLIKAYEFTQDVEDLDNYPIKQEITDNFVSVFTDDTKEVIRILNSTDDDIVGLGSAKLNGKLILVDPRLSYEITFQVRQAILGDSLSLQVLTYNSDTALMFNGTVSAVDFSTTNTAIDKESLLQNDIYYAVRVILFNQNIRQSVLHVPDIGFGNHLIMAQDTVKYISVDLGTEINDGNNDLRIYDFKVRPLMTNIANGFVMIPNIITSFLENNSEGTNQAVENDIKRYLIPYNSILKNQFLDEIVLPEGVPLTIQVSFTNETIIGAENGIISILANGGALPYQYSIDDGATYKAGSTFTNLAPAVYSIRVKDGVGTEVTDSVTIEEGVNNLAFTAEVDPLATSLITSDATITVFASGGTTPYYYSVGGVVYQGSSVLSGLSAGSHTVYVRDTSAFIVNAVVEVTAIRSAVVTFFVSTYPSAPVENANINVDPVNENYLTNAAGQAVIYLAPGTYGYTISKSGYRSEIIENQAVVNSRQFNQLIYKLYNATFIVKDSGGVGVPNASIVTTATPSTQSGFSVSTPSGSGTITKTGIIRGSYTITISASGFVSQSQGFSINTSNETVNIALVEIVRTVNITVNAISTVGGSALPLQNANVRKSSPSPVISKITNSSGLASFSLIPATYTFSASKSKYRSEGTTVVLGSSNASKTIVLTRSVSVTFKIFYLQGVDFWDISIVGPESHIRKTDQNGEAFFGGILIGNYTVTSTHPNGTPVDIRNIAIDAADDLGEIEIRVHI